jgi:hypothetical protein
MFDCGTIMFEIAIAVETAMPKCLNNRSMIGRTRHTSNTSSLTDPPADFMKKHAHQFIGYIGFSPTGRFAKCLA